MQIYGLSLGDKFYPQKYENLTNMKNQISMTACNFFFFFF